MLVQTLGWYLFIASYLFITSKSLILTTRFYPDLNEPLRAIYLTGREDHAYLRSLVATRSSGALTFGNAVGRDPKDTPRTADPLLRARLQEQPATASRRRHCHKRRHRCRRCALADRLGLRLGARPDRAGFGHGALPTVVVVVSAAVPARSVLVSVLVPACTVTVWVHPSPSAAPWLACRRTKRHASALRISGSSSSSSLTAAATG